VSNSDRTFVAVNQQISQSEIAFNEQLPTSTAVLSVQFPARTFEALTTAVYLSVADN